MGNFRTDDDYTPMDVNSYPTNVPENSGYDNPEMGDYHIRYGSIKKPNIFSRIFNSLGNMGSGVGGGVKNGITLEKVLFTVYLIVMLFVVINIKTVLNFLFYATVSILQYLIFVLVVVSLIFIFCRYILHIR